MYNILKIVAKIQADIFLIPSHVGIDGNDKADDLAKKGTLSTCTIQNKIRYTDAIQTFRNEMEKNTQKWFINASREKGKKFLEFQKEFRLELWHKGINLKGNEIKIINKILAGHDLSEFWLHKMKKKNR